MSPQARSFLVFSSLLTFLRALSGLLWPLWPVWPRRIAVTVRGCLHNTGVTFIPARVHSGSLLWLCLRLHDTKAKCHAGASHTGTSSPRFLRRSEIFIPARKFILVSCKRGMTVRFIFIKISSILRHYKGRTPTNTALCKHSATFHLALE